jgi:hypothetical protein
VIDRIAALIVDEGKWLTASLALAAAGMVVLALRTRGSGLPFCRRILAGMNLGAGITIGAMAFGHILAVATKLVLGTLREGSLLVFFAIGIVLLIPAAMVVGHTRGLLEGRYEGRPTTVVLNGWLAATLLALGLHNLPLAAPALLTIAYRVRPSGFAGVVLVGLTAAVYLGLFAASLVFLASGQSFEQFRRLE